MKLNPYSVFGLFVALILISCAVMALVKPFFICVILWALITIIYLAFQ